MIKMFLAGWFIVQSYTIDGTYHNYLFYDPIKQVHVSHVQENTLGDAYKEDTWIKLRTEADCNEMVEYVYQVPVRSYVCSAVKLEKVECTIYNSFIVNGVRYC